MQVVAAGASAARLVGCAACGKRLRHLKAGSQHVVADSIDLQAICLSAAFVKLTVQQACTLATAGREG